MREKHSPQIEERLKHIKDGTPTPQTAKRRKFSRYILIVDIFLILLIFWYFNSNDSTKDYTSKQASIDDVNYIFSVSREKESYLFNASLSTLVDEKSVLFNGTLAQIIVSYNDKTISQYIIGENVNEITVMKQNSQHFYLSVPAAKLLDQLSEHNVQFEKNIATSLSGGATVHCEAKIIFKNQSRLALEIPFYVKEP